MTITVTSRAVVPNAGGATATSVTGTITPSASSVVLVVAFAQNDNFETADLNITIATTITGWTTTLTRKGISTGPTITSNPAIAVFEGVMGASPSSGTITIDWDTGANTGIGAFQVIDLTGDVAIPTLKQAIPTPTAQAEGGADAETCVSPSLGTAATTGNTCIVAFGAGIDVVAAAAAPSGWAAIGTPSSALYSTIGMWSKTDFTGTNVTSGDLGEDVSSSGGVLAEYEEVASFSTEQEGFRFRNDDGSETTATWAATQDTNASVALSTNIRLRALVNTTGDSSPAAPTLYHKLSTDSVYSPVPIVAAPFPVIEGTSESSTNTAGTSHPVTLPAGIVASDLVLILMDIGSTSATLNALTDWGEILDESSANGLKILRYTGAGVPSDPTFTSSASTRSAQIAYRISNADKTITPQIGTTAAATDAAPDPPSVTPTGGITKSYLFIAFYGAAGEEADDDTWSDTPPTNYLPSPPLQKACGTAGTNLGGMIAAASRQLSTGSAENPGTFAKDVSAAWRAQTIIVHPIIPPVYVSPSANITAGGEATTAQLTAPSGKSTSDFTTGRMWDDENGADSIDIAVDDYTELEWSLQAQAPAVDTNIYQFRVYRGATPLDMYTVTPQLTIGAGDFGGTATPAVIALAATLPAVTTQAGAVKAPAVTALAATIPAATGSGSKTVAPAVTALAATLPAPTPQAGYTKAATVTALAATIPAATGSGSRTITPSVTALAASLPAAAGSGSRTIAPTVTALTVTIPAATGSGSRTITPASTTLTVTIPAVTATGTGNAAPVTIPLTVTIPPVSASGGGSGTASPATTTLVVTIPAATTKAGATASPLTTPLTVTIPAVTASGTGLATPATIPLSATIPAATGTGGGSGTASPATVTLSVVMPAPTATGGVSSTATPATTTLSVTMPAVVASGSKTATPTVIPLVVTLPAATGQGGSSATATPNTLALVTVQPSPTLQFGYVVNPAAIQLVVAIAAAIAQGLQPDAYPITVTLRDEGHTVTVRVTGNMATIYDDGHTATVREVSSGTIRALGHTATVRE